MLNLFSRLKFSLFLFFMAPELLMLRKAVAASRQLKRCGTTSVGRQALKVKAWDTPRPQECASRPSCAEPNLLTITSSVESFLFLSLLHPFLKYFFQTTQTNHKNKTTWLFFLECSFIVCIPYLT